MSCKYLKFCLSLILCVVNVKGYYDNVTNKYLTIDNSYLYKSYRHDNLQRGREPRFLSFETKDNNIEVEMSFNIPFITIPIKKSINGALDMAQSAMQGIPLANINVSAIVLSAIIAIGGTWLGSLTRIFQDTDTSKTGIGSSGSWFRDDKNVLSTIMDGMDKSFLKYDIDSTACTQRIVCWYVKNASINVADGKATQMDKIIDGLTSSNWALDITSGTAIDDAIKAGRKKRNCGSTFSSCKLGSKNIEIIIKRILQSKRRP